jgi:tetratricopeptide (TPR) repeat protein
MALVKLGRKEEAGHTIDVALTRDPDNAVTHANMGWALLESGDPEKALHHFQEALRIDPTSEWARSGIVEAMKARHIIYRWMLGYFLWMMRFSPKVQMALLFGIVIGNSVLANLAEKIPLLRPLKVPIIVCYLLFVLMTWIAQPLFNLILRLNRFGRLALSREQIVESNWLGGYLICSFVLLILGVVLSLGSRELNDFLDVAIHALLVLALSIPLCGTFNSRPGWPKILLVVGTIALTLFAVLAIGLLLVGLLAPRPIFANQDDLAYGFFMICVWGIIISTWVSTALAFVPHRK